uniref:Uncharacterized protein n=1 Tax=Aegilops tauschii subsp. strangulata TaxID=200361 RepID=A0A453DR42_AEGTS
MASSASLLHPSTLAPASSRPLPRRGLAPPQLGLRSSPRRPRGVSLTVAAAASPDVEKAPSSSPPAPSDEPSDLAGRGGEREGAQGRGQDEEGAGPGGAGGAGQDQEGQARHLQLLRDPRRDRVPRQDMDAHLHRPG